MVGKDRKKRPQTSKVERLVKMAKLCEQGVLKKINGEKEEVSRASRNKVKLQSYRTEGERKQIFGKNMLLSVVDRIDEKEQFIDCFEDINSLMRSCKETKMAIKNELEELRDICVNIKATNNLAHKDHRLLWKKMSNVK